VPRRGQAQPKLTAPTTVRFRPDLLEWLRAVSEHHPNRMAGVVNDAVEAHKKAYEAKSERIINGILGDDGDRAAPAQ